MLSLFRIQIGEGKSNYYSTDKAAKISSLECKLPWAGLTRAPKLRATLFEASINRRFSVTITFYFCPAVLSARASV